MKLLILVLTCFIRPIYSNDHVYQISRKARIEENISERTKLTRSGEASIEIKAQQTICFEEETNAIDLLDPSKRSIEGTCVLDSIPETVESIQETEKTSSKVSIMISTLWSSLVTVFYQIMHFLFNAIVAGVVTNLVLQGRKFVEFGQRLQKRLGLDVLYAELTGLIHSHEEERDDRRPVRETRIALTAREDFPTPLDRYDSEQSLLTVGSGTSTKSKQRKIKAKKLWSKLRLGIRSGLLIRKPQFKEVSEAELRMRTCYICSKKHLVFKHLCGSCNRIVCSEHTAHKNHSRIYSCDVYSKCRCVLCANKEKESVSTI